MQVSRSSNLKLPKQIDIYERNPNSITDSVEIAKAVMTANDKKYDEEKLKEKIEKEDKDIEAISKVRANSNDLLVVTVVKKLSAYVITVTEKSPKKYRGVFVNRMQNYCIDTLECLLQANFIRIDSKENKQRREEYQKEAIIKLKLLGYIAMLAETSGCILKKQYKQISIQLSEAINLTIAWKKSDDERWRKRNSDLKSKDF